MNMYVMVLLGVACAMCAYIRGVYVDMETVLPVVVPVWVGDFHEASDSLGTGRPRAVCLVHAVPGIRLFRGLRRNSAS